MDGTAPTGLTTINELSATVDLDWTSSLDTLSASWSAAADGETGLAFYSVSIGTTPGGADTYAWTSVGTATSHIATGLTLLSGSVYYFNVRAANILGVMTAILSADGVTVDNAAPWGGAVSHANEWRNAATAAGDTPIGYTVPNDGGAGVTLSASHTLERGSATLTTGSCGAYGGWTTVTSFNGAAGATGTLTDSFNLVADNCYQWRVVFRDDVDNPLVLTASQEIRVDTAPPTCAFTVLSESATTTWVAGSTLYFSNSASTSFAVEYSLNDNHSVDAVGFPALGAPLNNFTGSGMDNSSPYSGTYNIGPTTLGMQDPVAGANIPTCSDSAGNTYTPVTNYGVSEDSSGPTGGAISHLNGWISASDLINDNTIDYTIGTDAVSGISAVSGNQHTLQRLVATMTSGSCGAYALDDPNINSFAAAASATGSFTDTYNLLADKCYKWQIIMRDNVGNETTLSASSVLQTDNAPPHTCNVSALSDSGLATYVTGNTVWYGNGGASTFSASVAMADNHSAVSVSFPLLAGPFSNVTGSGIDTTGPFEQSYGTGAATSGSEDPLAGGNVPFCVDAAGNTLTATNSYSLRQDTTPPNLVAATVGHFNGWLSASELTTDITVSYTIGTDAGAGITSGNGNEHRLWRRVATLAAGACGGYADDAMVLTFPDNAGAAGNVVDTTNLIADRCYTWEIENVDNVSNSARVNTGDVIKTDSAAPATCQVSGVTTAGQFTWVNGVTGHYSTLGSGTFDVTYTGTDNQVFGDITFPVVAGGFANVTGGPTTDTTATYSQSYGVSATTTGSENPVAGANQPVCHDQSGNPTTATTNWALVSDTAAPTGGAISAPNSWTQTPAADNTIYYTMGQDVGGNNAGIVSVSFNTHTLKRMVAPLTAGSCGVYVDEDPAVSVFAADALSESSVVDTDDLASDVCYKWQLTMVDNVGNATTVTTSQTLLVDTSGPATCFFETVTDATTYTWVSASQEVYYSNLGPGNFTVSYSGSDAQSFAGINFPALAGGFTNVTGTGTDTTYPFQQTYSTSAATTGTETPVAGVNLPVCSDSASNTTAATTNYALIADNTGPTGGSISHLNLYTADLVSTRTISFSVGTDSGAGISQTSGNPHVIQRFVAPLTGDSCGAFVVDDANVVTFNADALSASDITDPDALVADNCYTYHMIMADNVGNTTIVSSGQFIRTDTTAPDTCNYVTVSDSTNVTWVSGSQVFYSALGAGAYSASFTGTDAHSFSHIIFPTLGGVFTNVTGNGNDFLAPYENLYATSAITTGTEDPLAGANRPVCVDMAANTTPAATNYSLIADNTGPTSGSVAHADLWQKNLSADNTITYNVGEDVGATNAGVHSTSANTHVVQRLVANLASGACGAYGVDDSNVATFFADALSGSTTVDPDDLLGDRCYKWQMVQADSVGNTTIVSATQSIRTDTSGPDTCTVSAVSDSTLYTWVTGTKAFYSNLGAGSVQVTYSGSDLQQYSHTEFPALSDSVFVNVSGSAVIYAPGPYTASFTTGPSSTGTQDPVAGLNRPVCWDTSANTTTATGNWSLIRDIVPPTGGATTYLSGFTNNLSQDITISYSVGLDSGAANAGIHSTSGWLQDIQRGEATMTAGSCGAYAWNTITSFAADAFSSSQFVDTADMAANRCYQWRLMQRDDVGNAAPTTPTLTLYTDTTQPSSCTFVTATKTSLNTWVNGSTVFYSNQGAGSFQIESTGTDVHSFSHIIFPTLGAPITNISGSGTDNAPAYTVSYTTGANSFGDASPVASRPTCVDKAGNGLSASTHFNLTRDITDPTGGTVTHFNGWQNNNLADQTVNYVIATDAGAGITAGNGNGHTLQRLVAPLSAGNCGAFAMDNTFVLSYSAATAQAGSVIDPYDRLSAKCYTWQIVMKDNVGNNVTRTTTDITKVDTSAPTAVSQLKDGLTATDEFYASSNNTLYANWQPGADAESGTVFYSYSIGTSPGLTNVVNWTDVSTSTSVTRTGLTLTLGATYYVNVRSGNNAITAGPVMSTNGVLVDNTVPSISFVNDGPGTDIDYQGSPEVLNANWAAAVAGPGGIREYSLSVGTSPGATNFIPWTNIGIATSWTSSSLPLQNGSTYYVNVRSVTNAGIVGPVRSTDGTLIDSVQPTIPFVNDGTLSGSADDLDYTRQLTTLSATWADPVVGPSGVAGVIEYSYSIGTSPGLANVVPWTSNGLSKTVTRSNLTLVDGTIYVVSVRVTNPAMVTSPVRHSDGILADVTPPPLTLTSPPAGYLTRVTSIPVTGTTESGTGVVVVGNGVNVPVTLGAVSGSVTVSEGLQVFTVVATDPSGNVTTVTRSIRVDLTLPQVALGSPAANTQTTPIGGILNILATVSDDVAVATVKVEYGPGATPTAYKQIGTTTNGAVNNQTIAQWDTTTLTGLYTLRLTGADTAGNTRVLTRQIYITNQLAPPVGMTLVKNAWHLFSVPGQPVPSDPKKFISGKYNVRRWNPLTPGVAPLYNYSTEFTAGPGQGFWVRTYDQDVTLSFAYNAQDSTQNYSLTLYNGWNMIGTPFNRSMPVSSLQFRNRATNEVRSFSSAVLAGWLDSVMWGYAGGTYVQVTDTGTLAPYSAYFLKLNENLDMIVNPAGGDPSGVARIVRKPLPVHRVGVSATQQGVNGRVYADVDNHVGLMHTAVEGRDVADAEEPPPTEDYLMVFAEGVDTGGKQARLASNYKAASLERGKETLWTVSTRTNQQGPVSVNFSLLNNENDAFLTHVTDLSSGEVLVLSAGAPLRFDYAANPAEGQVEEKTFLVKATRLGGALSAVSHSFETGWRLVSFPIDAVPTKAALQLGDDVKDPEIYQYYESVFTQVGKGEDVDLQAGLGFWLRLPEAAELDLEGVLPDPAQAIELPLVEGWNLIGNPFDGPLAWGDNIQVRHNASQQIVPLSVAVENGWIKSPLYQQSQEGAGYETTSTLQTWAGYFLLSQGNLTLLLKR